MNYPEREALINRVLADLPAWMRSSRHEHHSDLLQLTDRRKLTAQMLLDFQVEHEVKGECFIGFFPAPAKGSFEVSDMHYSLGATHYYGLVKLPRFDWIYSSNPDLCIMSANHPCPLSEVTACGPLSAKEIARHPKKYTHYKPGDLYPGFPTPEEAYEGCLRFINEYTSGIPFEFRDGGYTALLGRPSVHTAL